MEPTFAKEISEMNVDQQLDFYKEQFENQRCNLDGCGHQVNSDWVIHNSELYCPDCYEWKIDDESKKAKDKIQRLQLEIEYHKQFVRESDEGE